MAVTKYRIVSGDESEIHDEPRGMVNANGAYEPPAGESGQSGSPRESPTLNEANGEAVSE